MTQGRTGPIRVCAYIRVSTLEQYASGAGLAAQRKAIRAEVKRRGWELIEIIGEDSGASSVTLERAGLMRAMAMLDAGKADVLVVAKLDRLSRSVAQGAEVMDRAQRRGWSLVALDFGLDTTTAAGQLVANVILSTAQYERRLIGQRTRDALAAKREQGVRLGRPRILDDAIVQRIVDARAAGLSLREIAGALEADQIPTATGRSTWHATTIRAVLRSAEIDRPRENPARRDDTSRRADQPPTA